METYTTAPRSSVAHPRQTEGAWMDASAVTSRDQTGIFVVGIDPLSVLSDGFQPSRTSSVAQLVEGRLHEMFRHPDRVERIAPDEFSISCPSISHREGASIASRILDYVQTTSSGTTPRVHIGVALTRSPSLVDAQRDAIAAMHLARSRNAAEPLWFTESLRVSLLDHLGRADRLEQALKTSEFRLHYQPIIRAGASDPIGYEALIRWHHPLHGLLGPEHVIPFANDSELINQIGQWILHAACRTIRPFWSPDGSHGPRININVTARQLEAPDFVDLVALELSDAALPPHALSIEITEDAMVSDRTIPTLAALRATGVRISIDDFGTGFSSLAYLTRLPVDALKIDRSLIADLVHSPTNQAVASAIIDLAGHLNLEVVGEGVETERQWTELNAMGCDLGQGFLFAKPMPHAELARPRP